MFTPVKIKPRIPALLLCLLVLVWAPLAEAGVLERRAPALDRALEQALDYLNLPGAVVLVRAPGGGQWRAAKGVAVIQKYNPSQPGSGPVPWPWSGQAMHPDLHFRIASITKSFTATLVLILAQEKRLSLDDTLYKWLGGVMPQSREIKVRQLLNMTSGIPDYAREKSFMRATLDDPLRRYTPQELVATADNLGQGKLKFAPGADWGYSNTNYILLALIVEKVTGQSYAQALKQRVLAPLGLKNTKLPAPREYTPPSPWAHGYLFPGKSPRVWRDVTRLSASGPWSAGGMVSRAGDLLVWVRALAQGSLLTPAMHQQQMTWTSTQGHHEYGAYGLGVVNYHGAVGHTGTLPGYRPAVMHYHGYDFVILLNAYPSVCDYQGHYGLYVFDCLCEALGLPTPATTPGLEN